MSGFLKKISYAIETAKSVTKDAVCGNDILVSDEESSRRMAVCKGCEHYKELCGQARCNECGCMMTLKTQLASAKCPCGKW